MGGALPSNASYQRLNTEQCGVKRCTTSRLLIDTSDYPVLNKRGQKSKRDGCRDSRRKCQRERKTGLKDGERGDKKKQKCLRKDRGNRQTKQERLAHAGEEIGNKITE